MSGTLGNFASVVQVVTAALHVARRINSAIDQVRNVEGSVGRMRAVVGVVADSLARTEALLRSDLQQGFHRESATETKQSFDKLARSLKADLAILDSKIPKDRKEGRSRLVAPAWSSDVWKALRLYIRDADAVLERIEKDAMLLQLSLETWKTPVTEQRQDEPDSDQQQNLDLRNMYNALRTEETASDTSETAMASAPGALGAQEAQKARLRLVTALIVNRIQLAGDELSSTSASSTGLRHSAWAAEGAGAGQVEMQRRSQWAQTMAEHAEHLNFPEFAVALYGQSLSINRALKETCQVHFPFGYCAKIETQYSRALLSAGREEELRARLSDLTQLIDSYASGDATQIRDADALYCARRDVGSLLLHAGDRDGAEKYLREALFKGGELEEREGEPPNNDETRNLIMLIFRVYEDPVDIAAISKMRAFKDRIPGLLGPTLEAADLCKALDWCEANGFPPLNHASLSDREKDLLLHSHVDNDGRLPIHIAAMDKHIDPNVLQTLTSGGAATLDQVDNFGRTPLMLAVESSNCEAVHRLLHAGASVLVRREADGMTALHMCQNRDVLKSLLDGMNQRRLSAASIVMNNEQQRSQSFSTQPGAAPLLWRSRSGPPTSSAPVEAATSDIDVRDLLGKTPLHYACRLVDHDLAAQLLQYGANPNVVSDAAESPFMVACLQNKKLKAASQIATVLVQYGARVDKPEIWKALGKRGFPKKDMDALRKGKAKGRMSLG